MHARPGAPQDVVLQHAERVDDGLAVAYSYVPTTVLGDWGYAAEPQWQTLPQVGALPFGLGQQARKHAPRPLVRGRPLLLRQCGRSPGSVAAFVCSVVHRDCCAPLRSQVSVPQFWAGLRERNWTAKRFFQPKAAPWRIQMFQCGAEGLTAWPGLRAVVTQVRAPARLAARDCEGRPSPPSPSTRRPRSSAAAPTPACAPRTQPAAPGFPPSTT